MIGRTTAPDDGEDVRVVRRGIRIDLAVVGVAGGALNARAGLACDRIAFNDMFEIERGSLCRMLLVCVVCINL